VPIQTVRITIPQPQEKIDLDAARLQAAKVVTPAAVNTHGVRFLSWTGMGPTSTIIDFEVTT
jgi:hypothetical protein